MSQAPQVFDSVLQALEAETIQGHTAERVVTATRGLLNLVGISPVQILASMPVERHNAARRGLCRRATWFGKGGALCISSVRGMQGKKFDSRFFFLLVVFIAPPNTNYSFCLSVPCPSRALLLFFFFYIFSGIEIFFRF